MKREAAHTIRFRHWLRANPMYSGAYEVKQTTTDSIPFDSVKPHQIDALLAVKSDHGLLFKIPDDSRSIKPFDLFYLRSAYAWVVIKYPESFEIIDIETFLLEKEKSPRKSLTWERAKAISTFSI